MSKKQSFNQLVYQIISGQRKSLYESAEDRSNAIRTVTDHMPSLHEQDGHTLDDLAKNIGKAYDAAAQKGPEHVEALHAAVIEAHHARSQANKALGKLAYEVLKHTNSERFQP